MLLPHLNILRDLVIFLSIMGNVFERNAISVKFISSYALNVLFFILFFLARIARDIILDYKRLCKLTEKLMEFAFIIGDGISKVYDGNMDNTVNMANP